MAFQSTVAAVMAAGVVGEIFKGGMAGWNAQPGVIDSDGVTNGPNEFGRVFTQTVGVDGHCKLGGALGAGSQFYGILCNPKEHVLLGTTGGGTLAASLALPQYSKASFMRRCAGMFVNLQAAGNVGDFLDYDTTTGLIWPRSAFATTGVGTLASTSNVGTVAGLPGGSPAIGIGTVFNTPKGPATVISLGTGTGGNGTYNLSTVADFTATAQTTYVPASPTGRADLPGARVAFYNIPAAGLGVIALNNA